MKDKEIAQALRCCAEGECKDCAMHEDKQRCQENLLDKAAESIERLTAENVVLPDGQASAIESLRKEIEWKDMVIALAQRKQTEAEAERDALLEYAKLFTGCDTCKHSNYCKTDCPCDECEQDVKGNCYCKDCERGSNWEWRGLPEAPEENNAT